MERRPHHRSAPVVRVFAPAKINWVLTIAGRRPDGYHDIDTVFQALDWGDELRISPTPELRCRILCDDPAIPTGPDNLVARAWERLRRAWPDKVGGILARLDKRVPAGAGLGGGSSDAAAALVGMDRLFNLGLGRRGLAPHAAAIGSDCPFFLIGGAALAGGRGERLEPLVSRLPPTWLVIAWPGFPSSTARAYGLAGPGHWRDGSAARRVARAIEAGDRYLLEKNVLNVFSGLVEADDLRYKEIRERIQAQGSCACTLCGSGSSMVGMARGAAHARRLRDALSSRYPTVIIARPSRTGVRVI